MRNSRIPFRVAHVYDGQEFDPFLGQFDLILHNRTEWLLVEVDGDYGFCQRHLSGHLFAPGQGSDFQILPADDISKAQAQPVFF